MGTTAAKSVSTSAGEHTIKTKVVHAEKRGDVGGRWGHDAARVGAHVVLLGGCNAVGEVMGDMWALPNVKESTWTRVTPPNASPPPRCLHTLTPVGQDKVLLFGGASGTRRYGDVKCYNVVSQQWDEVVSKGNMPSARCAHSLTALSDNGNSTALVVFGGQDATLTYLNDVHRGEMHFGSSPLAITWSKMVLTADTPPQPRMYHTATQIAPGILWIIGGRNEQGKVLGKCAWSYKNGSSKWKCVDLPGLPPVSGHSATKIGSVHLALFGGCGENQVATNNLHLVNTETLVVTPVAWHPEGTIPSPRRLHTALSIMESPTQTLLLVAGGELTTTSEPARSRGTAGDVFAISVVSDKPM